MQVASSPEKWHTLLSSDEKDWHWQWWRSNAGTNYRGPAVRKGGVGPNMLHIFWFLAGSPLLVGGGPKTCSQRPWLFTTDALQLQNTREWSVFVSCVCELCSIWLMCTNLSFQGQSRSRESIAVPSHTMPDLQSHIPTSTQCWRILRALPADNCDTVGGELK